MVRTTHHAPAKPDSPARRKLLDAAGRVFGDKGFDRATGKEICKLAGVNAAAINYYFGGMQGLYTAVILEAHRHLFTLDDMADIVTGKGGPKRRLRMFFELIATRVTGPLAESWEMRVLGREFMAPTPASDTLRKEEFIPKSRILRAIVSELTGLPDDHPTVVRSCVNLMAPFMLLLLADRGILKGAFPSLGWKPSDAPDLARHMTKFALAGLSAVTRLK